MAKAVLGPTTPNQDPSDISHVFSETEGPWMRLGYGGNDEPPVEVAKPTKRQFPPSIMGDLDVECLSKLKGWLTERLDQLKTSHEQKMEQLALLRAAYKAAPEPKKRFPFVGASNDVIPVIAMAVDPIQARLDVGIMKQDPIFSVTPLRKSLVEYKDCLEEWVEFNQRHRWKLRTVAAGRFFEFCNLGTMIFKTVYDRVEAPIKTWERHETTGKFREVKKKQVRFSGAKIIGIPLDRAYFPPGYNSVDECPIFAEKLTMTYEQLRVVEASGKIVDVKCLGKADLRTSKSAIEDQNEVNAQHEEPLEYKNEYELFEIWFSYDIDEDNYPEDLVAIFEPETQTLLMLTYNWYFHQKKPYTVIPYTIQDGSMYGLGLGEMILPFQIAITKWHQMATDNAYLANIRMYIAKKNSGIEEVPRVYAGRTFYVEDPSKDLKPFQAGDIYPSTMAERQNLFGMVEKRTGVSDYLTGRESPILGSRATATSTLALIQEGTKRVEETLENVRTGFADMIEKAFCIWIQYGTEDLEDLVFAGDYTAQQIKSFFLEMSPEHVINGAIGVTLKATDAGDNKQARQQMQLSLLNIMITIIEKMATAATEAVGAVQQGADPAIKDIINETLKATTKLATDLLKTYDIRNPEQYLPDLTRFLEGSQSVASPGFAQGGQAGATGVPGGSSPLGGLEALLGGGGQSPYQRPEGAPSSGRPVQLESLTG